MNSKILYIICCITLFFPSCKDDDGDTTAPHPVSGISDIPGYGSLTFHWTNPTDADLYYVDITFTESDGTKRSVKTSNYSDSVKVTGFDSGDEISFNFTAYDVEGNASEVVSYTASPNEPAYLYMIDLIELDPDFGGVKASWVDDTGTEFSVTIEYTTESGAKTDTTFTSVEGNNSYYISGLESKEQEFVVTTTDDNDNSTSKAVTLTPLAETKFDKSAWTIVDYDSQEPAENPNGYASCAIDDDMTTYWHSAWASSQPGYPHWFIVDMGRVVTISRIVCYRRQGNNNGQTKCQFFTSVDGENWDDQGSYDFDAKNDVGQSYRMTANPQARYFKYVATEGPNYYAFLGEITVYGSVEAQ